MKWFKKTINAPSGETVELSAVELWAVRWTSKKGNYPYTVMSPEIEAFTNKQDAEHFCESLRKAFALVKHTAETKVIVEQIK